MDRMLERITEGAVDAVALVVVAGTGALYTNDVHGYWDAGGIATGASLTLCTRGRSSWIANLDEGCLDVGTSVEALGIARM
jgi:hypothetical protein